MKLSRSIVQHERFAAAEFCCRKPDNLLRVENTREGGVRIFAAKDCFTSKQRRTFVIYLKAEGFIPEDARLAAGNCGAEWIPMKGHVAWVFDPTWPYADVRFNHYTRRLCGRLLLGPAIAWLLFMWMAAFR